MEKSISYAFPAAGTVCTWPMQAPSFRGTAQACGPWLGRGMRPNVSLRRWPLLRFQTPRPANTAGCPRPKIAEERPAPYAWQRACCAIFRFRLALSCAPAAFFLWVQYTCEIRPLQEGRRSFFADGRAGPFCAVFGFVRDFDRPRGRLARLFLKKRRPPQPYSARTPRAARTDRRRNDFSAVFA